MIEIHDRKAHGTDGLFGRILFNWYRSSWTECYDDHDEKYSDLTLKWCY